MRKEYWRLGRNIGEYQPYRLDGKNMPKADRDSAAPTAASGRGVQDLVLLACGRRCGYRGFCCCCLAGVLAPVFVMVLVVIKCIRWIGVDVRHVSDVLGFEWR